ncbi:helix-turn-helix domain-containing protein [Nocardia cyriacigeorgica]|uniref:Helix-turn-helix domain-containing protein n=1 Tax=Nocardia cyriacigeorgica TaxID=135487 RepID=A0A6P1CMP2_9NOCA|nr:HNH endonuclease [Nocardia cyriacigeorgica]NEW33849.1 helix-turn-helix domain-containing protein [Nocardia cyriacigeorgica]
MRNFGDPMIDRRKPRVPCSVDGCERKTVARDLCGSHYTRWQNGRSLDTRPLRSYVVTDDLAQRLAHYAPPGRPDECWEWTGSRNKGYGVISVSQSRVRIAHDVAWEVNHGRSLPPGMVVRHRCDNPPCVNPDHLVLGTHGDNNRDKSERGRNGYNGTGFKHLTPAQVREIRALHEDGTNMSEIARRFSRSRSTIIRVVKRQVFADIH